MSTNTAKMGVRRLLGPNDPPPVEIINADSTYPVVLVCEHAGQAIPKTLGVLGVNDADLQAHIAWDIGAAAVARSVADQLGATLILQRYSRLVIDCNRPPEDDSAMPSVSDGVAIPANQTLTEQDRQQRVTEIFAPYQKAVSKRLARQSCAMALSIHSFTRHMAGTVRPWDIGFLYRKDTQTSADLAAQFHAHVRGDKIGMNEPYQIDDETDWFVPRQGEASGRRHSLIEICNDLINTREGQQQWATWLTTAIQRTL